MQSLGRVVRGAGVWHRSDAVGVLLQPSAPFLKDEDVDVGQGSRGVVHGTERRRGRHCTLFQLTSVLFLLLNSLCNAVRG